MAQPPPGPPGAPTPGARPGVVTAAGIILIVAGGLGVIFGLLAFAGAAVSGLFVVLAIILLAIGAVEIYAGVLVLQLRERGRIIGLVAAGVGALLNVLFLIQGDFSQIIGLALNGFVIWALATNQQYFRA
jgi:hypothetical protein